ncbi:hypothetical protein AGDE_12561 [Angomonas deanei]|uniref:Uncharacterized protein n=1 Tax=Angomonas deanei TaxID=59799 RepID=A0A7G2CEB2_9TRYP|nr:hypothetical protein AGDE_12561 [Angomonas deanei]CAD2217214.1 hypothetical protein, conserved [Angomonas deanei]|eukprot:EPY24028.1 hypothetical protein AGDE_12561 [Angomonas deanei]
MGQSASTTTATPAGDTEMMTCPAPVQLHDPLDHVQVYCLEISRPNLELVQSLWQKENGREAFLQSLGAPVFSGTGEDTVAGVKDFLRKRQPAVETTSESATEEVTQSEEQKPLHFYVPRQKDGVVSRELILVSETLALTDLMDPDSSFHCVVGERELLLFYTTEEGEDLYGMDDICCIIAICGACVACCAAVLCCAAASGKGKKTNNNNNNNKYNNNNNNNNYNSNNNNNNYNQANNNYGNNNNANYNNNNYNNQGYSNPMQPTNTNTQGYGMPPQATNPAPAATPNYYNYSNQAAPL